MIKIRFVGLLAIGCALAPGRSYSKTCQLENVRQIRADGINAWHAIWTQDGKSILFGDFGKSMESPLYIGDIHTTQSKLLANGVEVAYDGHGFSPDGSAITVSKVERIKVGRGKKRQKTAGVLNVQTGEFKPDNEESKTWVPSRFRKNREARATVPTFESARDGLTAFLARNGSYYLRDKTGTEKKVVVKIPGRILDMDWLPGDDALVASVETKRNAEPEGDVIAADLFIIYPRKKLVVRLTNSSGVTKYAPKASPNGKHIAFLDLKSSGESKELNRLMVGDLKCDFMGIPDQEEGI